MPSTSISTSSLPCGLITVRFGSALDPSIPTKAGASPSFLMRSWRTSGTLSCDKSCRFCSKQTRLGCPLIPRIATWYAWPGPPKITILAQFSAYSELFDSNLRVTVLSWPASTSISSLSPASSKRKHEVSGFIYPYLQLAVLVANDLLAI